MRVLFFLVGGGGGRWADVFFSRCAEAELDIDAADRAWECFQGAWGFHDRNRVLMLE